MSDQIQKYLDAIPSAISGAGGHPQMFSVACALIHGFALPRSEARSYLLAYNQRCQPPFSEREVEHKLTQAETVQTHQKPRGHLLKKSIRHTFRDSPAPVPVPTKPKTATKQYSPAPDADLPKPMADGTRELLRAAFEPGEGVRISIARTGDDGREVPKDEGIVLTREEWLRKLDERSGDPNKILSNTARNGIFISINPLKPGGSRDSDVTSFRHALIECDSISQIEQWRHIVGSNVPVTAVINSGGKSIHAWVRVDAKDRKEYDERVRMLHQHFLGNGYTLDEKNKNPSRFSRLPNCVRGKSRQELLALRLGADSFGAWHADLESESIGQVFSIKRLLEFDITDDPDCLLGNRWICREGSCVWVGQSGIGKSSLAAQAAISWALGQSFFGIKPVQPLKSLFIQAENDEGDLAEMVQGVVKGFGDVDVEQIEKRVVFVSDGLHIGDAFCVNAQRLIDKHSPDLVWVDPLLSFVGGDISDQSVCSHFLRTMLGPVTKASRVAWMMMHHTGKPPKDPKMRGGWNIGDYSYAGIGSSELTNWTRAAVFLQAIDDANFELVFAKRGKRAGATDLASASTRRVFLQHSPDAIRWLQVDEPPKPVKATRHKVAAAVREEKHKAPGRPSILDELRPHLDEFLGSWGIAETLSLNGAAGKLIDFTKPLGLKIGRTTAQKMIEQLGAETKLSIEKDGNGGFKISI